MYSVSETWREELCVWWQKAASSPSAPWGQGGSVVLEKSMEDGKLWKFRDIKDCDTKMWWLLWVSRISGIFTQSFPSLSLHLSLRSLSGGWDINQSCWPTWPQHLSVSHQGVQNITISSYTGCSFERELKKKDVAISQHYDINQNS